jgi:hypothetical protein
LVCWPSPSGLRGSLIDILNVIGNWKHPLKLPLQHVPRPQILQAIGSLAGHFFHDKIEHLAVHPRDCSGRAAIIYVDHLMRDRWRECERYDLNTVEKDLPAW